MKTLRALSFLAATLALIAGGAEAADQPVTHHANPLVVTAPPEAAGDAMAEEIACADPRVLNFIKRRFAWAEQYTWHRGFDIATIGNGRPSNHRFAEPGLVKRDFCTADAVMTDGRAHPVFYAIEHGLGFASIGMNVDFCVSGLDPWHVHDGDCRTVR